MKYHIKCFQTYLNNLIHINITNLNMIKNHLDLQSELFLERISSCISEGLDLIENDKKRNHVENRLKYMLQNLLSLLHCPYSKQNVVELTAILRNLTFVLRFFEFDKLIEKHFYQYLYKCDPKKDLEKISLLDNSMASVFVQYYSKCIVSAPLRQILVKINSYFTYDKAIHLEKTINFIPCISVFKECESYPSDIIKCKPKLTWLHLMFNCLRSYNMDIEIRLNEMLAKFLQHHKYKTRHECFAEFFCTIFLPMLDDLGYINCLKNDYDFLALLLYLTSTVLGYPGTIEKVLEDETQEKDHIKYVLQRYINGCCKLFPTCYDLISLKPHAINFEITQPFETLLSAAPCIYGYGERNFPGTGILSQLFLYAGGVEIEIPSGTEILLISSSDLLSRLPFEWKNFKAIHDNNFHFYKEQRKISTFKDISPNTYTQEDNEIYFSVLPNDAYMVLHYISRLFSYYLKLEQFESEKYLFDLYDMVLEETLQDPVENIMDAAEEVILKMQHALGKIPTVYTMPNKERVQINFFSPMNSPQSTEIPFFKLRDKSSRNRYIEHCGDYYLDRHLKTLTNDNSAVRLILYLATILQIQNSLKVERIVRQYKENTENFETLLSSVFFVDKNLFEHILYTMSPHNCNQGPLHYFLKYSQTTPVKCLGLGMLNIFATLTRPVNPTPFLLHSIKQFYHDVGDLGKNDIKLHHLITYIYFIFKGNEMLKYFYPCLMGVSLAYGGVALLNWVNNCITQSFDCDQIFLRQIKYHEFLEWSKTFDGLAQELSEDNLVNVEKRNIIYQLHSLINLINEDTVLRLCDVFYFTLKLQMPFTFINYCTPLLDTENGFEFYTLDPNL